MLAQGLLAQIPTEVWDIDWNVHCQAVGDGLLRAGVYLARYVFKVAIAEQRIVAVDDHSVHVSLSQGAQQPSAHDVSANHGVGAHLPPARAGLRALCFEVNPKGHVGLSCARLPLAGGSGHRRNGALLLPSRPRQYIIEPPPPMRCPHCGESLRFVRAMAPPRLHRSPAPTRIAL